MLFLAPEPVRQPPTGPSYRTLKLAEALAGRCDVTVAAVAPSAFPEGSFGTLELSSLDDPRLDTAVAGHDVFVTQIVPSPRRLLAFVKLSRRLVVDLIAPLAFEAAEIDRSARATRAVVKWRTDELVTHLAAADLIVCTNEKQRDLLIGVAWATGVLDPASSDAAFADRVVVVPHGVDPPLPSTSPGPGLRDAGLAGPEDRVAIWAGGIYGWFDPLTALKAIEQLRPNRPDLKLVFVGLEHPDPLHRSAHSKAVSEVMDYVGANQLVDAVMIRPERLSRHHFNRLLREADVGVSLHRPTLEAEFASRMRVLDYLAAGLPVVCTRGDVMSRIVRSRGLGRVIEPGDVEMCADALDVLTRGDRRRVDADVALADFTWESVARPLLEYCCGLPHRPAKGRRRATVATIRAYPTFARSVYAVEGPQMFVNAVRRRGRAALRRRSG